MSNGNGPERECAVVWRNMGGPVLTGKAVSVRLSPIPTSPSKKPPLTGGFFTWVYATKKTPGFNASIKL